MCTGHHADKNVPKFPGKRDQKKNKCILLIISHFLNFILHSLIQHSFLIFTNKTRSLTGLDSFKGEIVHSHDYKTLTGYEDKRIVVIGIGNSGGDAAVELSRVAKQVHAVEVQVVLAILLV